MPALLWLAEDMEIQQLKDALQRQQQQSNEV